MKVDTVEKFFAEVQNYFGAYPTEGLAREVQKFLVMNVRKEDYFQVLEEVLKSRPYKYGPPDIESIETVHKELRLRGKLHFQKYRPADEALKTDRVAEYRGDAPADPGAADHLSAGDMYAIAYIMTRQILGIENPGLADYLRMMQDAIADPSIPLVRDPQTFFERLLYPEFRRMTGRKRPTTEDNLPPVLWFRIRWNRTASIFEGDSCR